MVKTWKVEFRDNCKVCGEPLPNARYRTFCSKRCRVKNNNKKHLEYNIEWHRVKRAKIKALALPTVRVYNIDT